MKRSTTHLVAQRILALIAFVLFIGALKIWPIAYLGAMPDWVGQVGLALLFVAVLSGLGFGPWGRLVNALTTAEDKAYRESLGPKQPRHVNHDV
jgi:hypothetical protein